MRKKTNIAIILASIISLILFMGCQNPLIGIQDLETEINSQKAGSLILSTESSSDSRTIAPTFALKSLVASYSVTFSDHSEGKADFTVASYAEGNEITDVPVGTWNVAVTGEDSSGNIICTGTTDSGNPITITAGTNYKSLNISPIVGNGNGTLNYSIKFPVDDVDSVTVVIDPWPIGDDDYELTEGADYNSDFASSGKLDLNCSLASGQYYLTVTFGYDPGAPDLPVEYSPISEIVQIYDNLLSSSSVVLTIDDMTQPPEAPTDLMVRLEENNAFMLFWSDSSNTETGFRVYEGILDGNPEADILTGTTSASSADLGYSEVAGTEITYNVVSYNAFGESAPVPITFKTTESFTTIWKTDNYGKSEDNQITLPLASNGSYYFTVYWGDGSYDIITEYNDTATRHTYSSSGSYEVNIYGKFNGWTFCPEAIYYEYGDAKKLSEVVSWGPLEFGNTSYQFCEASNMIITATDIPNLSTTTSLNHAFYNNESITTIPNMGNWDVSNIIDMTLVFCGAVGFNQDISGWIVSNVTNMQGMFKDAKAFNQNIGSWTVSNVTDMGYMFYAAEAFNASIGNWDVSNVTNMSSMFYHATAFAQDIGGWTVSNVTDMRYMFCAAEAFNASIGNWDVSNVTNMIYMFAKANLFNQDIGGWTVSNVTYMMAMFWEAGAFNQNIGSWDVSNVTNMTGMFLDAVNFNQNIGGWSVTNVTDMSQMFNGATSFNQDINNWNVANVTDMSRMFYGATSFNQDINNWNVANVTDMNYMFCGATTFNQDISGWETDQVTDMSSMFRSAEAFDQNIGSWDITKVSAMDYMFYNATLSTSNYDALLTGWAAQSIQNNVSFNGGSSLYSAAAVSARAILTGTYGWSISDGGLVE